MRRLRENLIIRKPGRDRAGKIAFQGQVVMAPGSRPLHFEGQSVAMLRFSPPPEARELSPALVQRFRPLRATAPRDLLPLPLARA